MESLTNRFHAIEKFDVNKAFEDGWKGYTRNIGMGALVLFLGMLLLFLSVATVAGLLFAFPHIAVGLGLSGYYMAKGSLNTGMLFRGFTRYGRVLGAMLIFWLIAMVFLAVFSGPYYYHLVKAMSPEVVGEGAWINRFVTASATAEVQNWAALQYLAYPFQFYLQGRLLPLFPLMIDEDLSFGEAFAASWSLTRKVHWHLLLFIFLANVLAVIAAVVGMIGLLVGMFFTIPFPMALLGAATRQLLERDSDGEHHADT